jgi:integrase/recombinase XerD
MPAMDADLLDSYIHDLRESGRKGWATHRYQLGVFLRWLSEREVSLAQVNTGLVNEFLRHRKKSGCKPKTLDIDLCLLRRYFRWAQDKGLRAGNPAEGISCVWLESAGGFPAYQGPLRKILKRPYAMMRNTLPIFAPHWEEYIGLLLEKGHRPSYIHGVMNHNVHFHEYLAGRKVRHLTQVTPALLNDFLRQEGGRRRKEQGRRMSRKYLRAIRWRLVGFLSHAFGRRGRNFIKPAEVPASVVIPEKLSARYAEFCRVHGGLRPKTISKYQHYITKLGRFLESRGRRTIEEATMADLDAFLLRYKPRGVRGIQAKASALRSFFRYLHLNGDIPYDLAGKILSPRRFRDDRWPKYLPWSKVRRLLTSVDRSNLIGKRDFAILTLLACQGLRAREAARLRISDLDWEGRSFLLRERKNGTCARVPMSEESEQALRDYLTVRPACAQPEIFVAAQAPIRPLSGEGLSAVARTHLFRCFGRLPHRGGAYALRHSFAKALLDRGARLSDIGAMLGHKSLRSTLIYTRIATQDMREVADNYASLL